MPYPAPNPKQPADPLAGYLADFLKQQGWTRADLVNFLREIDVRPCPCWRARLEAIKAGLDTVRMGDKPCEHVQAMGHNLPWEMWECLMWACWPTGFHSHRDRPLDPEPRLLLSPHDRVQAMIERQERGQHLYHPADIVADHQYGHDLTRLEAVRDSEANRPWKFPRGQTHANPRRQPKVRVLHHELPDR